MTFYRTVKPVVFFFSMMFLMSVMTGCKKTELTGEYEIYQGVWESNFVSLELKANGRGEYLDQFGATNRGLAGRVIITGSQLRIASAFSSKNFNIDIPPAEHENEDGELDFRMQLDGMTFIRQ